MATVGNKLGKGNGHDKGDSNPTFTIHNVFLKDLSFESPQSPQIFNQNVKWEPKLDFDLQINSGLLSEGENVYEVVLHITATMKLGEGDKEKPVFIVDLQQAGVFTLKGFAEDVINQVLSTTCPTLLFPYAREVITGLASKGGFPQLILPPMNFEAMYSEHAASKGMPPLTDISLA